MQAKIQNAMKGYNDPLNILVLEDSDVDRHLLGSLLTESKSYSSDVRMTDTLKETLSLIEKNDFDIVLIDLNVSDSQGIDTLISIRRKSPHLPIVVNTGAFENELGLEALSFGAQDFLVKGEYNAKLLNKILHYAVERKRLEDQLKAMHRRLEDAQTQLIQKAKMEVVGELATGVAHEVKNPLSIIAYGITYLNDKVSKKDKSVEQTFNNLQEAIERADLIISDLLDFSSISMLHKQKNDLALVVDHALLLTKYELEKKNVKVLNYVNTNIAQLDIDAHRIQQVLINLILNAIAALLKGGEIKITVNEQIIDGEDSLKNFKGNFNVGDRIVSLLVKDQGCGISEDNLEHIYDPFFTTKRAKGGVGLGLSVSRQIMELHGGFLDISNNRGEQGVTACLFFKV